MKSAKKTKIGRPSKYTPDLVNKICAELATGRSARSICKDEGMPSLRVFFAWLGKYEEFQQQYARAKEESADALVEEMLDIADDGTNDWMQSNDPDNAAYLVNGEHVQRSRIRLDTRKWIASKLKPKKYGDKIAHTGSDGGAIQHAHSMSTADLERIAAGGGS